MASANNPACDDALHLCSYCTQLIENDDNLECIECHKNVHIKCLRHASTPGDLLGDVFFDFTCAKCMQLQCEEPSTSGRTTEPAAAREKFVRQRLPWLMVITLALYNLSIKSKGLGHHGYFHWRLHIISFINKNWDYLFVPRTRRRKNWIGSIPGTLSHNNPDFFISGQKVCKESGWWKLTYSNQTPKFIFKIYEQFCQKRTSLRNDKRLLEDNSSSSSNVTTTTNTTMETKRTRRNDSDDDLILTDSCSRTIPYMGRKPKIAKQLNIIDDEIHKNLQQEPQLLSSVQSSLMDFLAENLSHDDLNMMNNLTHIAPEPLVDGGKNDFLPIMEAQNENAIFFDMPDMGLTHGSYEVTRQATFHSNINSSFLPVEQQQHQVHNSNLMNYVNNNNNYLQDNSLQTASENSNEVQDNDDDDAEEYRPRIVQVTNFQQLDAQQSQLSGEAAIKVKNTLTEIKQEIKSDAEQSESEENTKRKRTISAEDDAAANEENMAEATTSLAACKASLFVKKTRRNWPWLVQKISEAEQQQTTSTNDVKPLQSNESLIAMSVYEEKELLHKLRKIMALDEKCQLQIPAFIRRFYRKLCVREWKREHSRPIFNLDDYLNEQSAAQNKMQQKYDGQNSRINLIDRYQLISLSTQDARKSFYARIAGSLQHELFESPYTQRVLHPFIYRSREYFPPWLKLMCELQHDVTGIVPKRSTIDFCYVRPNHIAAVNALLQTLFWPGIDMSECLSYPDFSVVALYKKLVVGCGFLVPDVGFNEAYISFMAVRPDWQRSGIATFMLYHLIQTCMSKDITLHVSASNPAVVLYQKFGFKIEEIIVNFYEKYLPIDSKHSRNAFFLRLMR